MKYIKPDFVAELGSAWSGSSVNCKPYAVEPMIRAKKITGEAGVIGTFFDCDGMLCAYVVPDNDLSKAKIKRFESSRVPFDAHDTPVIQSDDVGRIMILASSHRSRPTWLMSDTGVGIEGLVDVTSQLPEEMQGASYPSLIRLADSGSLWLLYRLGVPDRSHWRIAAWDSKERAWLPARSLLSGMATVIWPAGAYPNQPVPLPGDRLGIAYCWRSRSVSRGKDRSMNIGMDFIDFAGDFASARTSGGISLSLPVSPSNSERVIAVPWGAELMNQSGACAINDSTPCFVGCWSKLGEAPQIRFCWLNEEQTWQTVTLSDFKQKFTLEGMGTLPTLVSRPVVVPAGQNRVVVLYRTPEEGGQLVAKRLRGPEFDPHKFAPLLLVEGGLDQYEPVVERLSSASSGWLHVYEQNCTQLIGGDANEQRESADARLNSWRFDHLFC